MNIIEEGKGGEYPVGSVIFHSSTVPPAGWFLCNGSVYDEVANPELFAMLGLNTTPDFENDFVRGQNDQSNINGFPLRQWTTKAPTVVLAIGLAGNHQHLYGITYTKYNAGIEAIVDPNGGGTIDAFLNTAGAHSHTISGGDAETAPNHVYLALIIKGD